MPDVNCLWCSEYQVHADLKEKKLKKNTSWIGFQLAADSDKSPNLWRSQAARSSEVVRLFLTLHYVSGFHILSQGAVFQKQLLLFQIDHSWLYLKSFLLNARDKLHIPSHLLENHSSQTNSTTLYYKGIFIGRQCKTTELSDCKGKGQIFTLLQKWYGVYQNSAFSASFSLEPFGSCYKIKITMISNR